MIISWFVQSPPRYSVEAEQKHINESKRLVEKPHGRNANFSRHTMTEKTKGKESE